MTAVADRYLSRGGANIIRRTTNIYHAYAARRYRFDDKTVRTIRNGHDRVGTRKTNLFRPRSSGVRVSIPKARPRVRPFNTRVRSGGRTSHRGGQRHRTKAPRNGRRRRPVPTRRTRTTCARFVVPAYEYRVRARP